MDKTTAEKVQSRSGFTVAEVLVTVAILTILAAIAVPALLHTWREYKLAELDGTAKEIFLAAQNELTREKTAGRLILLQEPGSIVQTENVLTEEGEITYYYVTSGSLNGSLDQLSGFLSTIPGESVIYLNPRSGDITDVYYSKSNLSHETVEDLREQMEEDDNRQLRMELAIGYYGGLQSGSAETSPDDTQHLEETLELINGEDLYLKLVYPEIHQAFLNPHQVLAEITLTDEGGETVTLSADGDSAVGSSTPEVCIFAGVDTNDDYSLYVLLDSLRTGCSFTQLFPSLAKGDDITVTATLSYDGRFFYKNAPVGTVNSLYSAKYKADITTGGILHKKGVEFSRVRHLSNLRYYNDFSRHAVQIANLDFTTEVRKQTMLPIQAHLDQAIEFFVPVDLSNSLAQNGLVIDGRDGRGRIHTLKNFRVQSHVAGIFGSSTVSVTMQNLRLVDSSIVGEQLTGGLIGELRSDSGKVILKNCGVYQTAKGKGAVQGGRNMAAGSNVPTGGLIGSVKGNSSHSILLEQCFAAVDVTNAANQTGGLIGKISGGNSSAVITIRNCYASGTVRSGSSGERNSAGGLIGSTSDGVMILSSFSSSDVYGSEICGGLVGSHTGTLQVENSYTCGIVTMQSIATYGPLVSGSGSVTFVQSRYLSQSGNTAVSDWYNRVPPTGLIVCEYDALATDSSGGTIVNSPNKCHPYDISLRGKAYPFLMVTEDYYGDWPLRIEPVRMGGVSYGLSYYERYSDGSWGFYGYDESENAVDSLDYVNAKTIVSSGYAVVVPTGVKALAPNIGWGSDATLGSVNPGAGFDVYPILDAETKLATHPNQLNRYVIDNQRSNGDDIIRFCINPYFGAALSKSDLLANEEHPMQIRTEEQLRDRSLVSNVNWYFKQTTNITITQQDTGLYDNKTGCTYDGGGNTIFNLQQPLFSINNGIVKDLQLENVSIRQNGNVAALAVTQQGTLTNAHVTSGSIVSQSGNAAGLAWKANGGQITNCSVGTSGGPSVTVTANGDYAGGLVAESGGGSNTITNCKVVNTKISNSSKSAGGLVGKASGAIISECFVGIVGDEQMTVTANGTYAGGLVAEFQGGSNTITNCTVVNTKISNSSGSAGGLAGKASGAIISNCFVGIVGDEQMTVTANGTYAGGLVAETSGGSVNITNCKVVNTKISNTSGYTAGLIGYNVSTVRGSSVDVEVAPTGGTAAGFIGKNNYGGSVSNCSASGSVTALVNTSGAAGLIYENSGGNISLSYSNCTVLAPNGKNASGAIDNVTAGNIIFCYWTGSVSASGSGSATGFVRSIDQGKVSNCFAVGTATSGSGTVTGFVKEDKQQNNGEVSNCYTVVRLNTTSGSRVGFTASSYSLSGCYWVRQPGFNENVPDNLNPVVSFSQLKNLKSEIIPPWPWDSGAESWTMTTLPTETHPISGILMGQAYPYPRIKGLDYYGDWPS